METLNYQLSLTGTLVASGPGVATIGVGTNRPPGYGVGYAIGSSNSVAPTKLVTQSVWQGRDVSMDLADGEYLWMFGDGAGVVAVTAANPAAGDI